MSELLALTLTLQPPAEPQKPFPRWWGRAVHALALRALDASDPALARRVHDAPDAPRPFTASTVWGCREGGPCRLRLTALSAEMSAALRQAAAEGMLAPGAVVDLDGHPFTVTAAQLTAEADEWAGQASFAELMRPYLNASQPPPRRLRLQFASPVVFKSGGRHQPLPLPPLVFGSLLQRWNAFAPVRLPEETRRYAEECLVLQHFQLRSRRVPLKNGGSRIGSVGQVTYFTLCYDRYWMSVLHTLAAFAFFSGLGAGVTMGLGQCRRST